MGTTNLCAWSVLLCLSTLAGCDTTTSKDPDDKPAQETAKKKKKSKPERGKSSASAQDAAAVDVPAPPLPKAVIMGAAGEHDNLLITVRKADDVAQTTKSEKPKAGHKLMAVSVLVAAKQGSAVVAGAMFDLVGDGGKRYRSSILPCTDTPLKAGSATPAAPVEGDLCFVVPSDGGKFELMLKSGGKDVLPFKLGF